MLTPPPHTQNVKGVVILGADGAPVRSTLPASTAAALAAAAVRVLPRARTALRATGRGGGEGVVAAGGGPPPRGPVSDPPVAAVVARGRNGTEVALAPVPGGGCVVTVQAVEPL